MRKMLVVGAAVFSLTGIALADDLFPPPWEGAPGFETSQGWEFDADLLPTYVNNPYGLPTITTDFMSEIWLAGYEGRQGVFFFDAFETVYFDVPNADNDNPRKEVWMQITYFAHDGFPGLSYGIDGWGGEMTGFAGPGIGPLVLQSTPNGDWVYEAIHWFIEPNPAGETITLESFFFEDMYIDQIHIDTICIPEPGTIGLLLVGVVGAMRRR